MCFWWDWCVDGELFMWLCGRLVFCDVVYCFLSVVLVLYVSLNYWISFVF